MKKMYRQYEDEVINQSVFALLKRLHFKIPKKKKTRIQETCHSRCSENKNVPYGFLYRSPISVFIMCARVHISFIPVKRSYTLKRNDCTVNEMASFDSTHTKKLPISGI